MGAWSRKGLKEKAKIRELRKIQEKRLCKMYKKRKPPDLTFERELHIMSTFIAYKCTERDFDRPAARQIENNRSVF